MQVLKILKKQLNQFAKKWIQNLLKSENVKQNSHYLNLDLNLIFFKVAGM